MDKKVCIYCDTLSAEVVTKIDKIKGTLYKSTCYRCKNCGEEWEMGNMIDENLEKAKEAMKKKMKKTFPKIEEIIDLCLEEIEKEDNNTYATLDIEDLVELRDLWASREAIEIDLDAVLETNEKLRKERDGIYKDYQDLGKEFAILEETVELMAKKLSGLTAFDGTIRQHSWGGQAFTEWSCKVCGEKDMDSTTLTPNICPKCIKKEFENEAKTKLKIIQGLNDYASADTGDEGDHIPRID